MAIFNKLPRRANVTKKNQQNLPIKSLVARTALPMVLII